MAEHKKSDLKLEGDDLVLHTQCPVCEGDNLGSSESIHFRGTDLHYSSCGNCEHRFMNPMPTQDWYNRLYAQEFWEGLTYNKSGKQTISFSDLRAKQLGKELKRAKELFRFLSENSSLPEKGTRVLEIGCAFGLIGRSISQRLNGQAFGVEPSDSAREFASAHSGVNIVARNIGELSKWRPKQRMNITVMSHVLENIVEPLKALSQIHHVLDNSGLLVVEMSNPVYTSAFSIYHPHVYSKKALTHLVQRAGFSLIKYETLGRPVNSVFPRFQRVIASKAEKSEAVLARPKPGFIPFALKRRIGRSFWKISKRFSIKPELDSIDHLILDDVERSIEKSQASIQESTKS